MFMVVAGFANKNLALQFEWTWQNPHNAQRSIRDEFYKNKKAPYSLKGRMRALRIILSQKPWCHMPLKLQVLSDEYFEQIRHQLVEDDVVSAISLPDHVQILKSGIAELPVGPEDAEEDIERDEETIDKEDNQDDLCQDEKLLEESQQELENFYQVLEQDEIIAVENNRGNGSDEDAPLEVNEILEVNRVMDNDDSRVPVVGALEDNKSGGRQKNKCSLCQKKLSGNQYKCCSCRIVSHVSCLADDRLQGQPENKLLPDEDGACPHCGKAVSWSVVLENCFKESTWSSRRQKQNKKKPSKRKTQQTEEKGGRQIKRSRVGKSVYSEQVVQQDDNTQHKNAEQIEICKVRRAQLENQDGDMQDKAEVGTLNLVHRSKLEAYNVDNNESLNTDIQISKQADDTNVANMNQNFQNINNIKFSQVTPTKESCTNNDILFSDNQVLLTDELQFQQKNFQLQIPQQLHTQNEQTIQIDFVSKICVRDCNNTTHDYGSTPNQQIKVEKYNENQGALQKSFNTGQIFETPKNLNLQREESIINLLSTENKITTKRQKVENTDESKNPKCIQISNLTPVSVDLLSLRKADYLLKEYNFSFQNTESTCQLQSQGLFQINSDKTNNSNCAIIDKSKNLEYGTIQQDGILVEVKQDIVQDKQQRKDSLTQSHVEIEGEEAMRIQDQDLLRARKLQDFQFKQDQFQWSTIPQIVVEKGDSCARLSEEGKQDVEEKEVKLVQNIPVEELQPAAPLSFADRVRLKMQS